MGVHKRRAISSPGARWWVSERKEAYPAKILTWQAGPWRRRGTSPHREWKGETERKFILSKLKSCCCFISFSYRAMQDGLSWSSSTPLSAILLVPYCILCRHILGMCLLILMLKTTLGLHSGLPPFYKWETREMEVVSNLLMRNTMGFRSG